MMALTGNARSIRWTAVAAVIVMILGTLHSADAQRRGGGSRASSGSVQGRFGGSSAGRARQSSASRSQSSNRFSSGGFSSTGQMSNSRGSYQ